MLALSQIGPKSTGRVRGLWFCSSGIEYEALCLHSLRSIGDNKISDIASWVSNRDHVEFLVEAVIRWDFREAQDERVKRREEGSWA